MTQDTPGERRDDSAEAWKQFQRAWLDAWAKAASEGIGREEFAKMMGDTLKVSLDAWSPFRQQMERILARNLEQMNLPSRAEVTAIGERLMSLELRLDDLHHRTGEIMDAITAIRRSLDRPARARRKTPAAR